MSLNQVRSLKPLLGLEFLGLSDGLKYGTSTSSSDVHERGPATQAPVHGIQVPSVLPLHLRFLLQDVVYLL